MDERDVFTVQGGEGRELPGGDAPVPSSTASAWLAKHTGQVSAARSSFSPGEAVGPLPSIIQTLFRYRH